MDETTDQRAELVAILKSQGLALSDDRVDALLGSHRGHLRGAARLRAAVRSTDEPAHIFAPLTAQSRNGGVPDDESE